MFQIKNTTDTEKHGETMIRLADMCLNFAKTNRATLHQDGVRPESDTDHTFMLSLIGCSLASQIYKDLNIGKIAQYAIVHDLVEVYAGDTDTVNITEETKKLKEKREHEAFIKIKNDFQFVYPWIHETIEEYESQLSKEARYIKMLDKLMSEMTNILNGCAYFEDKNHTEGHLKSKLQRLENKISEFPELLDLYCFFANKMLQNK